MSPDTPQPKVTHPLIQRHPVAPETVCACQRERDDEADRKLRAAMMVIRQGCLLIAKGLEREFLDDQRKDTAA